ncbi:hypothetical protein [Streptomyces sp. NPDC020965]|uniref:hypothetical protein n=1 Tax=Streptomyces sp. NPDC020965 TaxID=3365105 RepID=UPI0037ABE7D8
MAQGSDGPRPTTSPTPAAPRPGPPPMPPAPPGPPPPPGPPSSLAAAGAAPELSGDPGATLTSLHTTHQLADGKVGILAGVQAALVAACGPWAGAAHRTWADGGPTAVLFAALFALFVIGFLGGVICLALALRPRLWRPTAGNRFGYRDLAGVRASVSPRRPRLTGVTAGASATMTSSAAVTSGAGMTSDAGVASGAGATAPPTTEQDDARERVELWHVCRFLASVTIVKCRYLDAALACTTVMAAVAGLSLLLRAFTG